MTISDELLTTTDELLGRTCEIGTTASTLSNWQARPFYLFISLKNRKFTKDFLVWFVELCKQYHQQGKICVVDEPYLFNRKVALGVDELPEPEVEKIEQISWEIERKVWKAINGGNSSLVSLVSWDALGDQTPAWMRAEIWGAFEREGDFYQHVIEQVVFAKGAGHSQECLESYAGFFLCEVPVLTYAYYGGKGIVDIYPGVNAELLWKLELGRFELELPRTTEFILSGRRLIYINVQGD